jgi:hypothetical protein
MANYFQLRFEHGVGGYAEIVLDKPIYEHFRDVHFYTGRKLKSEFPPTTVNLKSRPKAPDCIGVGSLDLVSEELRDFLVAEKINAEFIEVEVLQSGQRTAKRYFEMNLLDVFACLDASRSKYDKFPKEAGGGILTIHELYLDESKIGASLLFVLGEKVLLLVREDLADALRSSKFTGLGFKPLPKGLF